jgi:hypothetical protein
MIFCSLPLFPLPHRAVRCSETSDVMLSTCMFNTHSCFTLRRLSLTQFLDQVRFKLAMLRHSGVPKFLAPYVPRFTTKIIKLQERSLLENVAVDLFNDINISLYITSLYEFKISV